MVETKPEGRLTSISATPSVDKIKALLSY